MRLLTGLLPSRYRWAWTLLWAGVFFIAFLFRFLWLARLPGLNGDEFWCLEQAGSFFAGKSFHWFTPTHRPIAFFYALVVGWVDTFLSISFWVVRLPAATAGVLSVLASLYLFRRVLSPIETLTSSILIACAPVLIAYSRIGWELCLVPLAVIFPIYFSFRGKLFGFVASLVFGIFVHPTVLYVTLATLGPLLWQERERWLGRSEGERKSILRFYSVALAMLLVVGALYLSRVWADLYALFAFQLSQFSAGNLAHFLWRLVELSSGSTAYIYYVGGKLAWMQGLDFLLAAMAGFVLFLGLPRLLRRARTREQGAILRILFVVGVVLSWFAFLLTAGLPFVSPGYERYALNLVVPAVVAFAILFQAAVEVISVPWRMQAASFVLLLGASVALASFYRSYFTVLKNTGGSAHVTYRTGNIEPKQAALQWMLDHSQARTTGASGAVWISTGDWNTFHPIRYLARKFPQVRVIQLAWNLRAFTPAEVPSDHLRGLEFILRSGGYLIAFSEDAPGTWLKQSFPAIAVRTHTICDNLGHPILEIAFADRP